MRTLEHDTRQEWLALRREYLTATDVARLYTSATEWSKVRAEKDGTAPDVRVSPEMQWGIDREPALVAFARSVDRTVVANDRVHVSDEGPWAATPDGVGDMMVVECKTGSVAGLERARRRHMAQVQWQMWVCGADFCLFVTEVRDTDGDGLFVPGRRDYEWVDRDDDVIAELLDVAERFLAGDDVTEIDVLIDQVVQVRAEEEKARARRTEAEDALRELIGDRDFTHEGPFGRVSLTLPKPRESLDVKRLRAERPDVASEYTTVTDASKRTLRVSEVSRG